MSAFTLALFRLVDPFLSAEQFIQYKKLYISPERLEELAEQTFVSFLYELKFSEWEQIVLDSEPA